MWPIRGSSGPSPRSLLREVHRACRETSGAVAIECAVAERLHQAVPFDAWCALTIDPASVLPTGGFHEYGVPAPLLPHLAQIEAHADDPLAFPTLTRSGARVHTLRAVTAGHPDTATHYRRCSPRPGWRTSCGVAFTTTAGIWGVLVFFRGTDVADFTAAEIALIDTATAGVADAIRRELVLTEAAASDAVDAPGVICSTRRSPRWPSHPPPSAGLRRSTTDTTRPGRCPGPRSPSPPAHSAASTSPGSRVSAPAPAGGSRSTPNASPPIPSR